MTISDIAIRRPVFTTMLCLSLVVLGVLGAQRLGTELWPNVTIPFATITTVYPGASPQDIENQVTRPLEEAIAGIPGIDRLFSQTRENVSLVFVQFKLSVPLSEAVQQVRDKVGAARMLLPRTIDAPVIAQFDVGAQPIVVFTASSTQDVTDLRELLDDEVRPRLEQVQGVAAARILGGNPREIAVDLLPDRMRMMNLPPDAVFQRIRGEHLDLPAGHYAQGSSQVGVRVLGEFKDVEALRHMVVATAPSGQQIHLSDVAKVEERPAEAQTLVRTGNRLSLAVEVVKQPGANTVKVAAAVREELAALKARMGERLNTEIILDQSTDIEANAHEVWVAIYFGGAMAVLIILFFLLDWRGTLISALALPTSVFGTLFVMWVLGFSLNQITLISLSLAIGLLIDDAVVVRESITRRLELGDDPQRAASVGTQEIALAVMATTFTLCAVFLPVAFMQGIVAQFFRQFGLTIAVAVLISLAVAFTLDPMLSARFVKPHRPNAQRNALVRGIEGFLAGLDRVYGATLRWVLGNPKTTFALALAVLGGTLWLGTRLGSEFLGPQDRGQLTVAMQFPAGTRLDVSSSRAAAAEAEVMKLPGMRTVYSVVGPDGEMEKVRWRVLLKDKADRSEGPQFYKDKLREILDKVPEGKSVVSEPPMMEGVGDWPPIWVQVIGPDYATLRKEAEFVAQTLRETGGAVDVQVQENPGKPELAFEVNREAAAKLNLPAGAIAMQVRMATQGDVVGKIRDGRRLADIRVRLAEEGRNTPAALEQMRIWGPNGPVELGKVATAMKAVGPAVIEHEARERQLSILAQIGPGHDLGSVSAAMRDKLAEHTLPQGYSYSFNGQVKDLKDMLDSVKLALLLALVFIYMVLASQFESLMHPFTIMLSLPLAMVGAILGLAAVGHPLSLGAAIGLILLMGLVTKNAILLVDGALQHVREGQTPLEAMNFAGPRRLRPILMTSGAMVLGMLPIALGHGPGSEFRAPMAIGVIGGVLTSTLLTLWVVPVVFVWFERLRGRGGKGAAAPQDATENQKMRRLATGTK